LSRWTEIAKCENNYRTRRFDLTIKDIKAKNRGLMRRISGNRGSHILQKRVFVAVVKPSAIVI